MLVYAIVLILVMQATNNDTFKAVLGRLKVLGARRKRRSSDMGSKLVTIPSKSMIPERDIDKSPILECINLGIQFGGLKAVEDFDLTIGRTEIAGSHRTQRRRQDHGVQPADQGVPAHPRYHPPDGKDTHGMNTMQVNKAGIARTFQNIRLFNAMSVEDNVKTGMENQFSYGMWSGIFRAPKYWKQGEGGPRAGPGAAVHLQHGGHGGYEGRFLPYGAQRRLEIVRALATIPSLLLLDEPAAGMNPSETAELMENIRKIRDTFQIAVLLIEHDMNLVMNICEGLCVLNFGRVIAKGTPEDVQANPCRHRSLPGQAEGGLSMGTILKVDDINVYYGSIHAIKGISFEVEEGEVVTLIGANGAGKSTTLNTISGLLRSKTGSIEFMGQSLAKRPQPQNRGAGPGPGSRGRRIFLQMTVQENLEMGAFTQKGGKSQQDLEKIFALFPA